MELTMRSLHLLAAAVWGGGLVMLAVFAASSRNVLSDADRSELFRVAGRRFLWLSLGAAVVIAVSGAYLADQRYTELSQLTDTTHGSIVIAKTAIFAVLVVLAAIHSLILGPRLRELKRAQRWGESDPELPARIRRAARAQGIVSGLLLLGTVAIFVLAADLVS